MKWATPARVVAERCPKCLAPASSKTVVARASCATVLVMRSCRVTVPCFPANKPQHSNGSNSRAWDTIASRISCGIFSTVCQPGLNATGDAIVAAQIGDGGVGPTEWACWVFRTGHLPEFHLKSVIDQQSVGERFPDVQNLLD